VQLPRSLRVLRLEGDYIDVADVTIHAYGERSRCSVHAATAVHSGSGLGSGLGSCMCFDDGHHVVSRPGKPIVHPSSVAMCQGKEALCTTGIACKEGGLHPALEVVASQVSPSCCLWTPELYKAACKLRPAAGPCACSEACWQQHYVGHNHEMRVGFDRAPCSAPQAPHLLSSFREPCVCVRPYGCAAATATTRGNRS